MFDNVGTKIKARAKAYCIIETIGFIILGVILLFTGEALLGITVAVGGCAICWGASLMMYAIGNIEENIAILTDIACRKALDQKENDADNQDISSYLSEL